MGKLFLLLVLFIANIAKAEAIDEIEQYLNGLHNVTADFVQTDSHHQQQKGKFFLSRPGKMRWQYEIPKRLLLIINGKNLIHVDQQLEQVSYFKNKEEFLSLLTDQNITFNSGDIKVEKLQVEDKEYILTLSKRDYSGAINLIFTRPVLALSGLKTIDESKKVISIKFLDLKEVSRIDAGLFGFKKK